MSLPARLGLAAALASTITSAAFAQQSKTAATQKPAATKPAATKPLAPAPAPSSVEIKNAKEPLATVNGEPITRGEVIDFLSNYPIPVGKEQEAYDGAMTELTNRKLLIQYLNAQRVVADPKEVDAEFDRNAKALEAQKQSITEVLKESGLTVKDLKDQIAERLRWHKYVTDRATDAQLTKVFDGNKDIFNGKAVRASHILVKLESDASAADKEKAKQKIAGIRKEIESGKISFADAANKYSEDDMGETKNGGDLDFFPRRGKYLDAFADAAFAMKKGDISPPVLTEYGYHLLQVTDVRDGNPVEFKQIKPSVAQFFAAELYNNIIESQRQKAKVDIKPLPKDLFPKVTVPAEVPATTPAPAGGAATKKAAATPKR